MWFWSVSWSTNCPVYFSLFLVDQKKICSVSGNLWSVSEFFLVSLWFFGILKRNFGKPKRNLVDQKNQRLTKNSLRLNKYFFGRPRKVRNRPDNRSTKRLTKTTWTGLMVFGWPKKKLVDQNKWEIDRTIGWPRDWPKPHGRDYGAKHFLKLYIK